MSASFLEACAVRADAALAVTTPALERQASTTFDDVLEPFFAHLLPINTIAALLAVSHSMSAATRARLKELLPSISPILLAPFYLSPTAVLRAPLCDLRSQYLGDAGVKAFAEACSMGAMAGLRSLNLENNQISDDGVAALATVIKPVSEGGSGALANCRLLILNNNKIGDVGMQAFASAVASGAMARCSSIELSGNPASEEAKQSVQLALKSRWLDGDFLAENLSDVRVLNCSGLGWGDAEMTKLAAALEHCHAIGAMANELDLTYNKIGDDGMKVLSSAVAGGALAPGAEFFLGGNNATEAGKQAVRDATNDCGRSVYL